MKEINEQLLKRLFKKGTTFWWIAIIIAIIIAIAIINKIIKKTKNKKD